MPEPADLTFPDLYQRLLDAGRLRLDPETDRWFLDGRPIGAADMPNITEIFRRAVSGGP